MFSTSARKPNRNANFKKQVMKKLSVFIVLIVSGPLVFFSGCSKSIEGRTDKVSALAPANIDLNAGTWKPILLTSATEFAVAAPIATNTPDYIAQMNEIKSFQANLTA